jgi:hypothetical protein
MCALGAAAVMAFAAAAMLVPETELGDKAAGRKMSVALASINLAANNHALALGNTALAQRMKEQCPCALAGNTMLSQQVLKECPCASAVAAAVTKALNDALMTSSANNYAYARSSPGVPPQPLTAEIAGDIYNARTAYPPGISPQAFTQSSGPTPAQAAAGQDASYMNVIQTLTRDVVADANMIRDLQSQQEELLRQQNTVANQIDTFQAQVLKSTLLLSVRGDRVLGHFLYRTSSFSDEAPGCPKGNSAEDPRVLILSHSLFQNIINHPSIYITYTGDRSCFEKYSY